MMDEISEGEQVDAKRYDFVAGEVLPTGGSFGYVRSMLFVRRVGG